MHEQLDSWFFELPVGGGVRWTDGCDDGCIEGWDDGWLEGIEGWAEGWLDGSVDGCVDGCIVGWLVGCIDGCDEGWLEGCIDGCDDGWVDGWPVMITTIHIMISKTVWYSLSRKYLDQLNYDCSSRFEHCFLSIIISTNIIAIKAQQSMQQSMQP